MKINIIITITFFITCFVGNAEVETLSVHFNRLTRFEDYSEKVIGIIYHFKKKSFIQVSYPISQIISMDDNVMTLYYPDEKEAIVYTSNKNLN